MLFDVRGKVLKRMQLVRGSHTPWGTPGYHVVRMPRPQGEASCSEGLQ